MSLKASTDEEIAELITRRRRQVLVSSIAYYIYSDTLISDATWTEWAKELAGLTKARPDIAEKCPLAEEFKGFDPSTGFDLPLNNPEFDRITRRLLTYAALKKMADRKKEGDA